MTKPTSKYDKPNHQTSALRLLTLLQEISLAVSEANETRTAFTNVLAHICRFMKWPLAHVYIWSEGANALVSSNIWYMVDERSMTPFRELSEGTQFESGKGLVGRVLESGEATYILDVRQEAFVRWIPQAEEIIRAYFAFPVKIDGKVTAVLEFFSPRSVAPNQDMTAVINHVSALLGLSMQRQQTLTRLKEREAQLEEAQRTAQIGHWEWDVVNDHVMWSPELYRIFGLSPDNFATTYEAFLTIIHPDDRAYVEEKVGEAYQNGQPFDYFHRIVRPDGEERVIQARGRPIHDQAGHIIKLYGTAQDMTKQKESELQLARTVRHLTTMLELGQAVTSTLDVAALYEKVLTLIRPLRGAKTVRLFLHTKGMLDIVAADQEDGPDPRGLSVPLDSDIEGEVWRNKRALLLQEDDCLQRLYPDHMERTGFQPQSLLIAPIYLPLETFGVLEAAHPDAGAFTKEDLRLLETAAAWTAIAIGNARQYARLQRRLEESDAMAAISNALTETLELDPLLQLIVNHAQKIVTKADWTTIHLLQPKAKRLELTASAGLAVSPEDYVIRLGEGISGDVMESGTVINVADAQTDRRRMPIHLSIKARSMLVAPVESRRRRIGTIGVQCATPGAFTADDERLLTILGVQAGMAIENARLYRSQARARKKAEKQRERMRHLAKHVVEAQEKERARIARELHDESGQSLTALKISLEMINSLLPAELVDIKESLQSVLELTDKTLSNLRLLSHNLRPPGLDVYGLHAALVGLCQDFETHTPLTVRYEGVEMPDLEPLTGLSLYRFVQEGLTNVAKHAEATEVRVALTHDVDKVTLVIHDNGRGFIPPDLDEVIPANGAGLVGMMERLEMVDGRLTVESTPGKGSQLTAVLPYTRKEL